MLNEFYILIAGRRHLDITLDQTIYIMKQKVAVSQKNINIHQKRSRNTRKKEGISVN